MAQTKNGGQVIPRELRDNHRTAYQHRYTAAHFTFAVGVAIWAGSLVIPELTYPAVFLLVAWIAICPLQIVGARRVRATNERFLAIQASLQVVAVEVGSRSFWSTLCEVTCRFEDGSSAQGTLEFSTKRDRDRLVSVTRDWCRQQSIGFVEQS